jgi:prepilin-type N-terminal cleavage/methylation domain-containing protein
MRPTHVRKNSRSHGFSLLELIVVIAIVTIVIGTVLSQLDQVQRRATAEQGKVDDFQQARDFLDQLTRDARQMGFPNRHSYDISLGYWQTPLINDYRIAAGLVKLTPTELDFQGDVDGSGNVSVVSYMIDGTGTCTNCIQRAQVLKVNGDPLTGQTNLSTASYTVQVPNVINYTSVFTAFDMNGTSVPFPIDINTYPARAASVRTIQVQLKVASAIDPQTGQQLESDIEGRIQIVNCSMASSGWAPPNGVQVTCQ